VLILAGPNGAGKTSFAREFLPNEGEYLQFVNADLIAVGLSPLAPDTAQLAAGRAMLSRIQDLVDLNADFAIETTLSGRWICKGIVDWKSRGYYVQLNYVALSSPELAIQRVSQRVSKGGHNIESDVILRRFNRSIEQLETIKLMVDRWFVYDNSGLEPVMLDSGENF
jgi:predicted ABC-type ATPase